MDETSVIYKYEIPMSGKVDMPEKGKILRIDAVGNKMYVWAEVKPSSPVQTRQFHVFNTGEEVPSGLIHVSTVLFHGGSIVRHVYVELPTYKG